MVDRWLSALDERVMFTANRQHLMEGTCEWILENKTYVSWLEGTGGKIIWIEGIPGEPYEGGNLESANQN